MSAEKLNSSSQNYFELLSKMPPKDFSNACDSLVDFQIPSQLLIDTANAVKNGRIVALVTTHQSYFEIETERRFCQELNEISPEPISTFLTYSAPAVESNIANLFKLRKPIYDECHLNMLGIIRPEDRLDSKYKEKITSKMEEEHVSNFKALAKAIYQGACLIIVPLEAKLDSGRKNKKTGKINGIQAKDTDISLTRMVKKKAIIIPCGIDGGYKVIDPDKKHSPTPEFIEAFSSPAPEKLVIFKVNELIDPYKEYLGKNIREMCHQIIIEVAKNVSYDARGAYQQFC
jgi:hypothetical protein